MPYIGNDLATQFQAFATQTITGDGSTSYTLDRAVANGKELLVYINNVKQEEGSGKSYTASGTTITFSEAVASGDSCYLVYMGSAQQTVTAPDNSVTSAMLAKDTSGNLTLDIAGDISLDADGGQIRVKDGGTEFGVFSNVSSDFIIASQVQDKDIIFQGNDDGSGITALTLDMSDAGHATFNNGITLSDGNLKVADTHGIDFSSTSDASGMEAELLDNYEEGTFTPAFIGATGGITYTSQIGRYTLIGDLCTVFITITYTLSGFSGSNLRLNIPFTGHASIGQDVQGGVLNRTTGLTETANTANDDNFHFGIYNGVSLYLYRFDGAVRNSTGYFQDGNIAGSFTYKIA